MTIAAKVAQEQFITFEINSYDETNDTFSVGQTEESVDEDQYDVDDFQLDAEVVGHMLGCAEPLDMIGRKFAIVPL